MILEKIKEPNDLHKIPLRDFPRLAHEIREFIIKNVSKTGGHLASNLGTVELTLALHNVLDFPEDKLIWDVGHQAYTHKILTGRKEEFRTLRTEGGLSGFPKRSESDCDSFDTGHSSNSISAGLGYVRARDINKEHYKVVSVIGDGALTGGMAYEAMNNAALLKTNFIIVLNDNNMSISKNIGGMSKYLGMLRTAEAYTGIKLEVTKNLKKVPKVGPAMVDTVRRTKSSIKQLVIPGMLFENIGLTYLGPVDGHDMRQMMRLFNEAKKVEGPVLVHVLTRKGKGYTPAESKPDVFHGTAPFDIKTGEVLKKKTELTYTDIMGEALCKAAKVNSRITAITAAMRSGTGLKNFSEQFPERFFDVGIAEGHAVTFAAGLALGGMIPIVCIYSSFLQRGFDQMLHDVCMQDLHVIFAIDRAGIVGEDGETHHGCFDLSYLSLMPNMTVMAPKNDLELREMLKFAVDYNHPTAIRYPKGSACRELSEFRMPIEYGKAEVMRYGEQVAVLALGSMVKDSFHAVERLKSEQIYPTLVNMRFADPIDTVLLDELARGHSTLVSIEENVQNGGMGEHIAAYMAEHHPEVRTIILSAGGSFIGQGKTEKMKASVGLCETEIINVVKLFYGLEY